MMSEIRSAASAVRLGKRRKAAIKKRDGEQEGKHVVMEAVSVRK